MNAKESETVKSSWQLFSNHLLAGTNATDAYLLAGYRTTSRPSAQAASARLRQHPEFAAYHDKRQRQAHAKSRRRTLRVIRRKLSTLDRIIRASAANLSMQDKHLIKTETTYRRGGRVVSLPCKLTALRQSLKLTGYLDLTKPSSQPLRPIF